MVEIYETVRGMKLAEVIARFREVQNALDRVAFEKAARADEILNEARSRSRALKRHVDFDAEVFVAKAEEGIDRYVGLSDEKGQGAAMTIEYGRKGYVDPETGEIVGAMEGLFVLHRACGLPATGGPDGTS